MDRNRFKDEGTVLAQFMDTIFVRCPKCNEQAIVSSRGYPRFQHPARVSCEHCGYNEVRNDRSWKGPVYGIVKRRCPYCGRRLEKRIRGPRHLPYTSLKCPGCGTEIKEPVIWYPDFQGKSCDPFFGLSLWFVESVRGHELWAYNREHLSFMKQLVEAKHREKKANQNRLLSNRLPKWMLYKKNRPHVLKAIENLQKMK